MAISEQLVIQARLDLSGVASDADKLRSQLDSAIKNIQPEINFGIQNAIAELGKFQSIADSIKLPVFGIGGEDSGKLAEASLKKIQAEIDAIEGKKAQNAARELEREQQIEARRESNAQREVQREADAIAKKEANSQKILEQLEKQFAASNVRVTQGEGGSKEAKLEAQILQESLKFKQQLAAIDKAGFSAADAENAKQLAAGINSLDLQKIEQDFEKINAGQRNFTGNLRDASELLTIASEKVKAFKDVTSAAYAEQRKATGVLRVQADDAQGLSTALKGLAVDLRNQVSTADLTNDAAKVSQQGYRSTAENLDVLRASEKLAISEQLDFNQSLGITATVLKSYNLPASEAGKVTDQLVATARAAKVPVGELGSEYDKLASTASSTGTKFNQLNSFIANAASQGINAKTSVGALNQALDSLQSGDFIKKGRELGIVFDEQKIKTGGLAEVLRELRSQGFDQNSTALNALFGNAKNVNAVLPSLQKGLETVSDASGIVNKNFDITANVNKAVGSANALKDALAEIGAAAAPFDQLVGGAIKGLTQAFAGLDPNVKVVLGGLLGLAGIGFTLSAVITGTLAVVQPTIGVFQALTNVIREKTVADVSSIPSAAAAAEATAAEGVAAAAATPAVGAFGIAANGAVVGVAALALAATALAGVAIGAGAFLLAEKDLRESNDALESTAIAVDGLGNNALQAAQRTKNLNDKISESAKVGKALTGQQIEDAKKLSQANEFKLKELDREAEKVANTKVVDLNKGTKEEQLNQIKIASNSLKNQNKILEEQLAIKNSVGAASIKEASLSKERLADLKKEAIAKKETQNQDSERGVKRSFDDSKTKRDTENAKALADIQEKNELKKSALSRQQTLETEALKERQTLALQDKQRVFDDAQGAKKIQREEEIDAKKRANEDKLNALKEAFDNKQNALKEQRAERQRQDDQKFADDRAARDKQSSQALSGAKAAIASEGKIASAKPEDRAKIAAQAQEEQRITKEASTQGQGGVQSQEQLVAKAKQIAQVQAIATQEEQTKVQLALDALESANRAKQIEIDKSEDLKRSEARRIADKAFDEEQKASKKQFETQQNIEKLAFEQTVLKPEKLALEQELKSNRLAFERGELAVLKRSQLAEERSLALQQQVEDAALKKAADLELNAIKAAQKETELTIDRKFEDAKIERDRAFKEQQRALDKASAVEIQSILGQTAKQLFDAVAAINSAKLRAIAGIGSNAKNDVVSTKKIPEFAGGVKNFGGGLALVGERGAELVDLPKGASVTPANDTRSLLSKGSDNSRMEALLERLIGSVNRPNLEIKSTDDPAKIAADIYAKTAAQQARQTGL